jgi:hypothetical protein
MSSMLAFFTPRPAGVGWTKPGPANAVYAYSKN